jgi:hypothetical protein
MITGYNTDVRHKEVVFHVQTEDKGLANPCIESLVYVGGQVLASKRASYAELLAAGREEKEIIALMDHQHRTMIAAIRHGKFDEKLAALVSGRQTGSHAVQQVGVTPPVGPGNGTGSGIRPQTGSVRPESGSVRPEAGSGTAVRPPAPPAARPASAPAAERTLDQVILEYLTSEADQEQLVLFMEGEQDLALGRRAALTLRASSSKSGQPVAGAQVTVKMISTVGEPQVLATGRTDEQGELPLLLQIPQLGRGTAALIITAVGAIGRAEVKHLL